MEPLTYPLCHGINITSQRSIYSLKCNLATNIYNTYPRSSKLIEFNFSNIISRQYIMNITKIIKKLLLTLISKGLQRKDVHVTSFATSYRNHTEDNMNNIYQNVQLHLIVINIRCIY